MWENPGDLYRALRQLNGWTLAQTEQATGLAGSYVGRIERGKHTPSPSAVERLKKAYAPNAGTGLLDAMAAAWSIPARLEEAKLTAEQALSPQLAGSDIGMQALAGALGVPWPDPNKVRRGYEWALWAVLVWAGDWGEVAAACVTGDPERVEAAIRRLPLPGGKSPEERDTAAEEELVGLWRRLDAVGRPMLLSIARDLTTPGTYTEHVEIAEALQSAFPDLGPEVVDALATLVRHLGR
jgi:transcriptional regulator with XRE-family HTH domain